MLFATVKVLAVAFSLGIDVFAVAVGVGVHRPPLRTRLRIGSAFAAAEVAMNCIGAAFGAAVGHFVGDVAGYAGFAALVGIGVYMIVESTREAAHGPALDMSHGFGLLVASLSISVDSLGVGFSILYIGVPPFVTLAAIAAASVCSSSAGLALGGTLGARVGERASIVGGVLLALTGLAFIALKALHAG